jgi:hypothetical protein
VQLLLRRRWSDGTTHLVFEPIEFLARLAALTPRPRINLILYLGVLAPRAAWRRLVVPGRKPPCDAHPGGAGAASANASVTDQPRPGGHLWAALMQRSFGFDVLACPRCGGRLRLIALIEQPAVVRRILGHLGLPTDIPVPRPSRAPPLGLALGDDTVSGDDTSASG